MTSLLLAGLAGGEQAQSMLRLLEQRKCHLDEPIGPYLDFAVRHPRFPKVPLTFRHLLTHTSGISDARYGQTPAFTGMAQLVGLPPSSGGDS